MPGRSGRFGRADRLRKSRDFRRVSAVGRRQAGPLAVVLVAGAEEATTSRSVEMGRRRLGLTVSRKVGGAVIRNRVKRQIREWFRRARPGLPAGTDWVVIARSAARSSSSAELSAELDRLSRDGRFRA